MSWLQISLVTLQLLTGVFAIRAYRLAAAGESTDKTTPSGRWAFFYRVVGSITHAVMGVIGTLSVLVAAKGAGLMEVTLALISMALSVGFFIAAWQFRLRAQKSS